MSNPTDKQKYSWRFKTDDFVVLRGHFYDHISRRVKSLEEDGWLLEDGTKIPYRESFKWMRGLPTEDI